MTGAAIEIEVIDNDTIIYEVCTSDLPSVSTKLDDLVSKKSDGRDDEIFSTTLNEKV